MAGYSAIFLDKKSQNILFDKFKVPRDWKPYCDHMTITLGSVPDDMKGDIGKPFKLKITKFGASSTNIALGVDTRLSKNKTPHITFAVDFKNGGRPKDSNQIKKWKSITPITVTGILLEK